MVPIYGILALWLSWYVKRDTESIHPITIWHELGHWAGLIGAIFLTSDFGILGTVSRFNIGIFDLILVSYALFLAGIYIETFLMLIGVILGLFALFAALFVQ